MFDQNPSESTPVSQDSPKSLAELLSVFYTLPKPSSFEKEDTLVLHGTSASVVKPSALPLDVLASSSLNASGRNTSKLPSKRTTRTFSR